MTTIRQCLPAGEAEAGSSSAGQGAELRQTALGDGEWAWLPVRPPCLRPCREHGGAKPGCLSVDQRLGNIARVAGIGLAGVAAAALRPPVRLAEDGVHLPLAPQDVVESFRLRMATGPDVMVAGDDALLRGFSGRAGVFPYRTVEIVRFEPTAITFEHVRGPFAMCFERFDVTVEGAGSRLKHSGRFILRGGLLTWPLAVGPVKRAFEGHVQRHLEAMARELATSPR